MKDISYNSSTRHSFLNSRTKQQNWNFKISIKIEIEAVHASSRGILFGDTEPMDTTWKWTEKHGRDGLPNVLVTGTRSSAIAKSTARPSCLGGVLSHIYRALESRYADSL